MKKPINRFSNKRKSWNDKFIEKQLLIITIIDQDQFISKHKLVIYTKTIIKYYNLKEELWVSL